MFRPDSTFTVRGRSITIGLARMRPEASARDAGEVKIERGWTVYQNPQRG